MGGKLHSLTDVLKKTLFFFEELSVAEIVPHVHRKMLKDYTQEQVEEKVILCLRQNPCFVIGPKGLWSLNLEGNRDNDQFYSVLLKRQQPMSIREVLRTGTNSKNKKKIKPLVSGEASLISDGRFIQLDNGYWGLTEWEVEAGQYSLKQLVIKAHKVHPGGLSARQVFEIVNNWRPTTLKAVEDILAKFSFFEEIGDGIWVYSPSVQVAYDDLMKRFIGSLNRMKGRWHRDRQRWKQKVEVLERQIQEVDSAYKETAAALAAKMEESGQHEYLVTQMAEKDLLLSLRKKEIYRYREHVAKLEAKANSILHQCRLWVKRARDAEEEKSRLREALNKNQASLEALFTKLQQYKEKDRENKSRLAEIKELNANKTAELQAEIVELRQKLEKTAENHKQEEKRYREEINILSNDMKEALESAEEAKRSLKFLQQELSRTRDQLKKMEAAFRSPLVKAIIKLTSFLSRTKKD
ncbi:MAG: phage-shock protein [Peptococcaceae bacterium]|nr:phage-shock protein [Peptococcaceae bacterium]